MSSENFSYVNLNNSIEDLLFEEHNTFFICLYNIGFVKNDLPFVQYLLYRQNIAHKQKSHSLASFPYIHYEENKENTIENINNLVNNLTESAISFKGFIKDGNNFFLFYEHLNPVKKNTYKYESEIVWGTIHEIVNQQKILNSIVHYNTFELFLKNTDLLHIKNKENENILIPFVVISKVTKNKCILDEIEKYDEKEDMFYIDDDTFSLKYDTIRKVVFLYFNSEIGEENYIYKENKYFLKDKTDASILSINHKN